MIGLIGIKSLVVFGLLVAQALPQEISLSGMIKDASTNEAIEGAVMRLSGAELADTTNAQGQFQLSRTGVRVAGPQYNLSPRITNSDFLMFTLSEHAVARLTVHDLYGQQVFALNQKYGSGSHSLKLPQLKPGIYFYQLHLGNIHFGARRIVLHTGIGESFVFSEGEDNRAGLLKASPALDTLWISRGGYVSDFHPIENYQATDIEVGLVEKTGYGLKDSNLVLPDPDNSPVATGKPTKVFILMGQSNMIGYGQLEPEDTPGTFAHYINNENKYSHAVDNSGEWTVRNDVYTVTRISGVRQGWHSVGFGNGQSRIGPEYQFGHVMGHIHDEMVLIIKSSIGNRALGWDILPPNSVRYEYEDQTFAGYGDSLENWPTAGGYDGARENCNKINDATGNCFVPWYAGKEFDRFTDEAQNVLNNIKNFFPDYNEADGYEIAGFGWFQGHRDGGKMGHATRYELNMSNLYKELKIKFDAPNAKFVAATSAFGGWAASGTRLEVIEGQLAAGDWAKHPEHAGNLMTVEARGYWREPEESPKNQDYHFNHNAETYYLVGNAMGWAMAELLTNQ